jgi:hypothetical protein
MFIKEDSNIILFNLFALTLSISTLYFCTLFSNIIPIHYTIALFGILFGIAGMIFSL